MTDIIPPVERSPDAEGERQTKPERLKASVFTTLRVTPEDTALWTAMGRLRAETYLKHRYISEDDIDENGCEFDEYDSRSDHFIAVNDDGDVIGTVRVINRGPSGESLPAEADFETMLPEQAQEISRLIRDERLSLEDGTLVGLSMMRAALKATVGRSETIYAVLEDRLHFMLNRQVGIHLRTIGEPKMLEKYDNTTNHLIEMTPRLITSQIHENDMRRLEESRRRRRSIDRLNDQPYAPFFERDNATHGLGRISLANFSAPNPAQFERNEGFYSREEQEKLWRSTVAIAGAGGDGGQLAVTLAMAGVRHFRIADPEYFEVQNLNRQMGASYGTIGHNKAEVIGRMLRDLGATVEVFTEGVTQENIERFIKGSDLVFDETEFTMPQLGAMIARSARRNKLPVLMALNVGFGSYTTSFDPDGITFEEYLGLKPSMSLEDIAAWAANPDNDIPISKWAPHIPSYANVDVLRRVAKGEMSAPTVAQGVAAAAADAGTQAVAHLLKDINPEWTRWITWAPHGRVFDVKDGFIEVKTRKPHFTLSVALAALRTRLGKSHPKRSL